VNPQQAEKIQLEHEAARLFMRLYQRQFHQQMQHIWHNQPAKPDVSCYFDGVRLDLEIAHLYGSEAEAMQVLGRALSLETQTALQQLAVVSPAERLLTSLNRLLVQKSKKHYDSDRVWLIIRNANGHWTADDFRRCQHALERPLRHPFQQIWIIGDFRGESGLFRLEPPEQTESSFNQSDL